MTLIIKNKIISIGRKKLSLVILALFVGIGFRLYLASNYYGNFDQGSYKVVVSIMKTHGNFYMGTDRYNYSPLWAYVLRGIDLISSATRLPFHTCTRGFLTAVDISIALLLFLIQNQNRFVINRWESMISYILNPVAILITGYHGQFENFAIMPLLLAVYLGNKDNLKNPLLWIWGLGTLSFLIKHITAWAVWVLFVYSARHARQAILLMICTILIWLLSFLPYLQAHNRILENVILMFTNSNTTYGLSNFLSHSTVRNIMYLTMLVSPFLFRHVAKFTLTEALTASFVSFMFLTYHVWDQFIPLPIPLGSLNCSVYYWLYSVVNGIFLLASPHNVHFLPMDSHHNWNIIWYASLPWWLSFVYKGFRNFLGKGGSRREEI